MNKLKIELYHSAKLTLDESRRTRKELLEAIDIEAACMGLDVNCNGMECSYCPLSMSRGKTMETVIEWLDETCPEEIPDTKSYKIPLVAVGLVLVGVVAWKLK